MVDKTDPKKRVSGKRVVLTSFLVDLSDVILSLIVAYLSGSVIMLAQLMEGASDLIASGLLYVGLTRSKKKPDRSHPFGYGRELYFWTLISALITFGITASLSVHFGWNRVLHPEPIYNVNLAILVLIITIATNGYALWLSLKRLLKNHSYSQIFKIFFHSSLIETKTTLILDLMGTLSSILGLISLSIYALTGDLRFDGIGSIIIGIMLAFLAYFLIISIKDLLIGKTASRDIERKIRQKTLSVPEVREVLDLKTMHIGSERLLVNMEVHLKDELTTDDIERLMDKIKHKIESEIPTVKHIQIELETPA